MNLLVLLANCEIEAPSNLGLKFFFLLQNPVLYVIPMESVLGSR